MSCPIFLFISAGEEAGGDQRWIRSGSSVCDMSRPPAEGSLAQHLPEPMKDGREEVTS